jgi:hypothetical protein
MSFPSSPTVGQQATVGGRLYQWTGTVWDLVATVTGHASQHAANGSDPLAISAGQVSGLSAVATSGSAADLSGSLADARLTENVALHPQLNTLLGQASGAVDSIPRVTAVGTITAGTGLVVWSFFTPATTITVSQITMGTTGGAVAAGVTLARMGIYTYTEGGTATLVARTASDTTLFTANNTVYTRSLATAGGFPATYTLEAGTRYGAAYICVCTTAPAVLGRSVGAPVAGLSPRLSGLSTAQTDLPSSFTPAINGATHFARLS